MDACTIGGVLLVKESDPYLLWGLRERRIGHLSALSSIGWRASVRIPGDPCCRIKTAYSWAGGLKAALGGAGVDNAGPVQELVGLLSAEASVSAAPLIQKKAM